MEVIAVSEKIQQISGFPAELRRHLLHMLLAHHGKLEYGSPKLPMTPEALMLAYLDDLDSKIEAMQRLMDEPHIRGDWTRMAPMFERPIYRRRPNAADNGDQETPTPTAATPPAEKPKTEKPRVEPANQSFNRPFEHLANLIKK
jgi:3'-5' exoribonuclease